MARRKSRAKQEEELFQGLTGLAMLGGGLAGFSLTKSWQGAIVVGILAVGVVIAVMI